MQALGVCGVDMPWEFDFALDDERWARDPKSRLVVLRGESDLNCS